MLRSFTSSASSRTVLVSRRDRRSRTPLRDIPRRVANGRIAGMSGHRKWQEIRKTGGPESEARVAALRDEMDRLMSLAELRKARELTQTQLAEALETTQPGVSAIENRTDLYVSTLRSYVEALGGRLEIKAVS